MKKTHLAIAGPPSLISDILYATIDDSSSSGKSPGLGKNLGISDTGATSSA